MKVWRPLLMGEYPPPGPTKLGGTIRDRERPILVYAEPLLPEPVARRSAAEEPA